MQIDPINEFSARAADNALRKVREYYELMRARQLAESNYLREIAEGIRQMELQRAKNQQMFDEFRRRLEALKFD